jgi:hypothetical protein
MICVEDRYVLPISMIFALDMVGESDVDFGNEFKWNGLKFKGHVCR